jgi:hypothetical protein
LNDGWSVLHDCHRREFVDRELLLVKPVALLAKKTGPGESSLTAIALMVINGVSTMKPSEVPTMSTRRFGPRMIDVLDGEIELVVVMLRVAAILGATIRQHPA